MRPIFWRLIESRLRRRLPPAAVAAACGDLLEDYDRRRQAEGRWRAEWWLVREAASVARAYRAEPAAANAASPRRSAGSRLAGSLGATATDLRIALRTLARQPLVTAAVVLPVALAIAASTALFSLTDGLLFREVRHMRDPGTLVAIDFDPRVAVRTDDLRALRDRIDQTPLLADRIWIRGGTVLRLPNLPGADDHGLSERSVSANFFDALGVPIARGRGFLLPDLDAGGPPPVVLGHGVWRTRFAGDPSIVGAEVTLADVQVRIVGVAPPTFDFPAATNVWSLWVPARFVDGRPVYAREPPYARLANGVSLEALRAEIPRPLLIVPLSEAVRPAGSVAVAFLFGATALLLLVSWLQVGALLFSRTAGRASEIGLRAALGAGRVRLVRIFAAEGVVVAVVSLALGWLVTAAFVDVVVSLLPAAVIRGQQVHPDLRSFLFASMAAAAGVLLLTVLPLDFIRRASPLQLLRGVVGSSAATWSAARLRSVILIAQVSVTVVLLYITGLLAHSFVRIATFDLGFEPDGLLVWSMPPAPQTAVQPGPMPRDPVERATFIAAARAGLVQQFGLVTRALEELRASPEIAAAATSWYRPVVRGQPTTPLTLPGAPDAVPIDVRHNYVTPEYFGTVGVRLVEGMTFEAEAIRGVLDVAIVNEALAARLRPHGPVVGQRIQTSTFSGRVVGIVGDHVDEAPDRPADPQFFRPHPPDVPVTIGLVRARGELGAARTRVRAVVDRTWGSGTPIYFTVMSDEVARVTAPWRGRAIFLSLLAALCLPLAIAGLVGALSYDTRGRAHEIAVRLALGADPARIRRRVVTRALGLVALGLAAGLGGGWLVGRLMDSYLFGVRAADATTMAGVGGVLVLCAWLAALGPAWRASRVDPALTLRRM